MNVQSPALSSFFLFHYQTSLSLSGLVPVPNTSSPMSQNVYALMSHIRKAWLSGPVLTHCYDRLWAPFVCQPAPPLSCYNRPAKMSTHSPERDIQLGGDHVFFSLPNLYRQASLAVWKAEWHASASLPCVLDYILPDWQATVCVPAKLHAQQCRLTVGDPD